MRIIGKDNNKKWKSIKLTGFQYLFTWVAIVCFGNVNYLLTY